MRQAGQTCFTWFALVISCAGLVALVSSCDSLNYLTRTETDTYTVTDRDTTYSEAVRNVPGATSDTSRVESSSRQTAIYTRTSSHDSVVVRQYPNFLRMGLIELAGVYSAGRGNSASGLFGAYAMLDSDQLSNILWRSELVRIAPVEIRLRWFNDAPNWTLGWSAFEHWAMDDSTNHSFTSIASNFYIRRRFYLRDQIPYIIFSPFLGVSAAPSAYANIGGEFHIGSFGGLNIRAYAGLISGFNWVDPTVGGTFPYAALGVSALDFTNRVEETEREWKYYTRTTINASLVDFSIGSGNWLQTRLASVQFPLPFANHHFWVGTSLVNYMAFDTNEALLGVLPVSFGYRQYLGSDQFFLEPYLEASYYPSTFVNAALRLKIGIAQGVSIAGTLGYATGSPGNFNPYPNGANPSGGAPYAGIGVYLGDWNYTPEKIQELRDEEIPSTIK